MRRYQNELLAEFPSSRPNEMRVVTDVIESERLTNSLIEKCAPRKGAHLKKFHNT